MAIQPPRQIHLADAICVSTDQILAALPAEHRPIFRAFRHSLNPPGDAPGCRAVAVAADIVLTRYLERLNADAHDELIVLVDNFHLMQQALDRIPLPPYSAGAMWRRLTSHEPWALLVHFDEYALAPRVLEGLGAELAYALATSTRFSDSLARQIRLARNSGADLTLPGSVPLKMLTTSLRHADQLFRVRSRLAPITDSPARFAGELRQWFRNLVFYASSKSQQAVSHHRAQTPLQFVASSRSLRCRVESADNLAAQACIGGMLHLRCDLVVSVPILGPDIDPDYVIAVDIDHGVLHFDLSLYAEKSASPSPDAAPGAVEPSSRVFVTPLPTFLADHLKQQRDLLPDARCVGHLLPSAEPLTRVTRTLDQGGMIAASYPRYTNSFAPRATALGIDRYVAAILTHDPRIVPKGKFYYALCTREETWQAANTLYQDMGWGTPVPLVIGLPGGSQVTPTQASISGWFAWMKNQTEAARPGASKSIKAVLDFHNAYSLATASLTSFLLALRHRVEIPLSGKLVAGRGTTIALGDKAVGNVPGPRAVPLPRIVDEIFVVYLEHLAVLATALKSAGQPDSSRLRQRIADILAGEKAPLFFLAQGDRATTLGTGQLEDWWPKEFGIEGNGGRHFFQNTLRRAGVSATDSDIFVRHSVRGLAPASSASLRSLVDVASRVIPAIDGFAEEAGLHPLRGLAPRKE